MKIHTIKYRRIGNFIAKKYRNCNKSHRSIMLENYPYSLEEFREHLMNDKKFIELFKKWEESGYNKRLSPGLDRIKEDKGYTFDNVIINTFEENQHNHGILTKQGLGSSAHRGTEVEKYDADMNLLKTYPSKSEAARDNNVSVTTISRWISSNNNTRDGYFFKE